jgi:GNAT superfamily N-acetyltransferase
VRIEQFDPATDDTRLRACHQMVQAGRPADDPNGPPVRYRQFRGWWAFGDTGSLVQTWLATDDGGEPAGAYLLELPQRENRANGFAEIIVAPDRRRRGAGRLLLAHLAGQAARADRTLLMASTRIGSPGSAFAVATGGREGLRDVRRVQDLSQDLLGRLPGLRAGAQPHAAGYVFRCWSGPTPDELVASMCAVYTALGDSPHEAEFEPATYDAGRLREDDQRHIVRGCRWHSAAALRTATGEVAAVTQVVVNPDEPAWGWQAITAVAREHRGHRLGLLVKVAMLERLAGLEPGLRHIVTYNAAANEHMIAVNDQLGYRVTDHFQMWEHEVAAARAIASPPGQS